MITVEVAMFLLSMKCESRMYQTVRETVLTKCEMPEAAGPYISPWRKALMAAAATEATKEPEKVVKKTVKKKTKKRKQRRRGR